MHFGPGPNKLLSNGSLKQVFSAAMDLFLHLSGAGGIALLLKDGEGNYRTHLSRGSLLAAIDCRNIELLVDNFAPDLEKQGLVQTNRGFLMHRGQRMVVYLLGMPMGLQGQEEGVMVAVNQGKRFSWESIGSLSHVISYLKKVVHTTKAGEYQYFLADCRMLPDLSFSTQNLKFSLDLRELLLSVVGLMGETVDYDICLLCLPETSGRYLACEVLKDKLGGKEAKLKFSHPVEAGIFPHVYTRKKPLLCGNIGKDECFDSLCLGQVVTSLMAAPVLVRGKSLGVLLVGSQAADYYREGDLDTLCAFASQVGVLNRLAANANFWEEYYHHIIESIPVAVVAINPQGNIMTYNCEAKQLLGLLADEFKGLHHRELLARLKERLSTVPLDLGVGDRIDEVLRTGVPFEKQDLRLICKRKGALTLSLSISPIRDSQERILGATVVMEDVTERRRLEEDLREAEKLAALGELAVGVAHEIRNPLTTIKGFCQVLQEGNYSPPLAGYTEIMLAEVAKIGEIIHNLLLLSNSTRLEAEPVNLNGLLESLLPLLQAKALLSDVEVAYHLGERLPSLRADPRELKRAFLNIFQNALQAMTFGGFLTVNTVYKARRGEIWLEVTDTGCGINLEDYKHIFNPFFTTKDEAVGLGLSVAHRIIQKHGGEIVVKSKVEEGTTVTVKLPVAKGASERGETNG